MTTMESSRCNLLPARLALLAGLSLPAGVFAYATNAIPGTMDGKGRVAASGTVDVAGSGGEVTTQETTLPGLSISDASVIEGAFGSGGVLRFMVSLDKPSASPVTFNLATSDGTAIAGSDYSPRTQSGATIPAGATSLAFDITVIGDTSAEAHETMALVLSAAVGATVVDGQGLGSVLNDDARIWIDSVALYEGSTGASHARFPVRLSHPNAVPVTFNAATTDRTALAGSDYVATTLVGQTIPVGQTLAWVSVPVIADTVQEGVEEFQVNLYGVTGTVFDGSGSLAFASILPDDLAFGAITTFAGNGTRDHAGDLDMAVNASLNSPRSIVRDAHGNIYVADQLEDRVRKISPDGIITTYAGNGSPGFSGDGGQAVLAALQAPSGLALANDGSLYIADQYNGRIRKVLPNGVITTIAGNGMASSGGDGGSPTQASLRYPTQVHVDDAGNIYIAETGGNRIRRIGNDGIIRTLAGTGQQGFGGDGGPASSAVIFAPTGMATDASGNFYFSDTFNSRIRKITPAGIIGTLAGTGFGFSGDGGQASVAKLANPAGLAFDETGSLLVADSSNHRIRRIAGDGVISTIAGNGSGTYWGDGFAATSASIRDPSSVAPDLAGGFFIADQGNGRIRRVAGNLPAPPIAVHAIAGPGQASVTLTPPASALGIHGYVVTSFPAGGIDTQAGQATPHRVISGLTNGVAYTFSAISLNANGASGPSPASNAVVPMALPALGMVDMSVPEGHAGARAITFSIQLDSPAHAGGASFRVSPGSGRSIGNIATAGSDYAAWGPLAMTIPAGQSSASFSVKVMGDTRDEADEVFEIQLDQVVGATPALLVARGTIVNDDAQDLVQEGDAHPGDGDGPGTQDPAHTPISRVQGQGPQSPLLGRHLRIRGVVTGIAATGFFLQSLAEDDDGDAGSSEAVFVRAMSPPAGLAIGRLVDASGRVEEAGDPQGGISHTRTELLAGTIVLSGAARALPPAIIPEQSSLDAGDARASLERLEGMRVSIPRLQVVGASGGYIDEIRLLAANDGVFHGVALGATWPFAERSLNRMAGGSQEAVVDTTGRNPKRLRVDSVALVGTTALAVDVGDTVAGLVGILDEADGRHSLLVDPYAVVRVQPGAAPHAASIRRENEVSIGYFNARRLFDDRDDAGRDEPVADAGAYALRLARTANAICDYMRSPDILGLSDVENDRALSDLGDASNARAGNVLFPEACQRDAAYRAHLLEGSDPQGLDHGFLVSNAEVRPGLPRVEVLSLVQLGVADTFQHPDGSREALNARPTLLMRARINSVDGQGRELAVMLAHFEPLDAPMAPAGHGWLDRGEYLRAKRRAQAAQLARFVRDRQSAQPGERLILLGGLNLLASDFDDGELLAGIQRGGRQPLVNPLDRLPAARRYSSVLEGEAVALDHVLVSPALYGRGSALRIEHARINADFAEDHYGDPGVPMRVSDRDPIILYWKP